ncbi:type II secretion system protein [Alicyclobacillus cellulosilyticus]|uniref:type II secretion system protein n=1 Tax=Alicyclobacillus cellulosilyticus TaxID=1003997 RepID=UPI0016687762|nr:type II secretion system protein GspG [Alicyclobacillus cellulosilyticus]
MEQRKHADEERKKEEEPSVAIQLQRVRAALAQKRQEGLTLIELLAVVVILAVIAAIAVPVVSNAVDQSKKSATLSTLGTLQGAIEHYYFDVGKYPSSLNDLTTSPGNVNNWNGPYMQQSKPYLDSWGNYIYYAVGSNKKYYILVAGEGNTPVTPSGSLDTTNNSKFLVAAGGMNGNQSIGQQPTEVTYSPGPPASYSGTGVNGNLTALLASNNLPSFSYN